MNSRIIYLIDNYLFYCIYQASYQCSFIPNEICDYVTCMSMISESQLNLLSQKNIFQLIM